MRVFEVSGKSGAGLESLLDFLGSRPGVVIPPSLDPKLRPEGFDHVSRHSRQDRRNHRPRKQHRQVEVGGVRRSVNIGMLDKESTAVGDYVLIHVGFAMSKVDEKEAEETLRMLQELGGTKRICSNLKRAISSHDWCFGQR